MKIIKIFNNYKKITLFSVFLSILISAYISDTVMFKIPKLLQDKTSIGFENRFDMYIRSPLMKSIDSVNPWNWLINSSSNLPRFNLEISQGNMDYMRNAIDKSGKFMIETLNEYQKCKIRFDNEIYKCEVRLHGSGKENWINKKKAYALKLDSDNLIGNMRRFSFIPLTSGVPGVPVVFSYKLLSQYFNFNVKSELVYLSINGISQGLYLLEEKAHKSVLEKNNLSGVDLIKPVDKWDSQYSAAHQDPFIISSSYLKFKNISEKSLGQLLRFRKVNEKAGDYEALTKLLDIEKFAQFDALRILFGSYGSVEGDNNKYLYDTSNGKFFPYPRIEGSIYELIHNEYSKNFESMMYSTNNLSAKKNKNDDNEILQTLVKNNDYRTLRNTYLNMFLGERKNIIGIYDFLMDKYKSDIKADTTGYSSSRFYLLKLAEARQALVTNLNKLDEYINYARTFTDLTEISDNKYLLEIRSDSNVPTQINSINFIYADEKTPSQVQIKNLQNDTVTELKIDDISSYFKDKEFMLSLDNNLDNEIDSNIFEIQFLDNITIDGFEIEYKNKLTNNFIGVENTYKSFSAKPINFNFIYLNQDLDDFIASVSDFSFIKEKDGSVTIKKGDYRLTENLVFPYGIDLNIQAGTSIKIGHKKSLIINGALNIYGKSNNPVVITSLDINKPFGVVAAIGNNQTKCNINFLDISNGSESMVNGSYLSGALSLYSHENVLINDSKIHNNFADDGLNIKNASVEINKSEFFANFADQIDLDFTNAVINNSLFTSSDEDLNGDGLDLSGSKAIVKNSSFYNFADKGISVGENTKIYVSNNFFKNNRSAVTGKDESKLYFYQNNYSDNLIDIEAYVKKPIFNAPTLFLINEDYDNKKLSTKDSTQIYILDSNTDFIPDRSEEIFDNLKQLDWQSISLGI